MARNVVQRILDFNRGRDPERLSMKYKAMRENPFVFLRGSCHNFFEDLRAGGLVGSPPVWICGDLHLENFGCYKGDNRLVYFDVNDFDEAALGPCLWDVLRFLTSLDCAAQELALDPGATRALKRLYLLQYAQALQKGKALWVERATAHGPVRELLRGLKKRKRSKFLAGRVRGDAGRRRISIDGKKTLAAGKDTKERLAEFMRRFGDRHGAERFFTLRDAARRVAGTGSLGIERYVLLVEGRGSPDGNFLLDLKLQTGSAAAPWTAIVQPDWGSEAKRVVFAQRTCQAVPPALLEAVKFGGRPFLLKELQPSADKLSLSRCGNGGLDQAIGTMAQLTAWGHLRGCGRRGAATVDELLEFGHEQVWRKNLLDHSRTAAELLREQWREYAEAFDHGAFEL